MYCFQLLCNGGKSISPSLLLHASTSLLALYFLALYFLALYFLPSSHALTLLFPLPFDPPLLCPHLTTVSRSCGFTNQIAEQAAFCFVRAKIEKKMFLQKFSAKKYDLSTQIHRCMERGTPSTVPILLHDAHRRALITYR